MDLIDEDDPMEGITLYYKQGSACTESAADWPGEVDKGYDDGSDDDVDDSINKAGLRVTFKCVTAAAKHVPYAIKVGTCAYEVSAEREEGSKGRGLSTLATRRAVSHPFVGEVTGWMDGWMDRSHHGALCPGAPSSKFYL